MYVKPNCEEQGIARRNDMPQLMAVRRGHIDGAATWRMLLKQRRRRLRCRFGHFRTATLISGFDFQHDISFIQYAYFSIILDVYSLYR